jgi:TPR repeat protein
MLNEPLRLTDAQRREAKRRARAGDAEAAKRLADEALYVEQDFKRGVEWIRLAASYGDEQAKRNLKTVTDALRDAK